MLSCYLSVGILCLLGTPVSVEIGDAMFAYHGRIRQDDVEIAFELTSDDIGLDDPRQRLCLNGSCFVYESRWIEREGSTVWGLSIRQEGVSMDDQRFSFSAPSRAQIMALIGEVAIRPEVGERNIPLASFVAGTHED